MQDTFCELDGNLFMCSDSPPIQRLELLRQQFLTTSECENERVLATTIFRKLSENG